MEVDEENVNIRIDKATFKGPSQLNPLNPFVLQGSLSMGKPSQLTRKQVKRIKKQNAGSPILKEIITIKARTSFLKEPEIRENDFLLEYYQTVMIAIILMVL